MNRILINRIKSILWIAITSLTTVLSGSSKICSVCSEKDVCVFLKNACDRAQYFGRMSIVFIDIDNTLIIGSSDFVSYAKFSDFTHMVPINKGLAQTIRILSQAIPDTKFVALTSAKCWGFVEKQGNCFDLNPYFIKHGINSEKKSISQIRSEAMAYLNFPFASFGKRIIKFPFVTKFSPLPLFQTIRLQCGYYPHNEILLHRKEAIHGSNRNSSETGEDLYVRRPESQEAYEKVLAYPVYENGVIFSNFIDRRNAWQKGSIMRSFLFSIFGEKEFWPLISIIAIDDNWYMLRNMQEHCHALEIPFLGLHLSYMEKPVIRPLFVQQFLRNFILLLNNMLFYV